MQYKTFDIDGSYSPGIPGCFFTMSDVCDVAGRQMCIITVGYDGEDRTTLDMTKNAITMGTYSWKERV